MFAEKTAYLSVLFGIVITLILLSATGNGMLFDYYPALSQSGVVNTLIIVIVLSAAVSAIISRIHKNEIKNYYKYSKKDVLVFSVLALYFLSSVIYGGFFYSLKSFSAMNERCESGYIGTVYYNPNQEELWPGQFREARAINSQARSSCYSSNFMAAIMFIFAGLIGLTIFIPMAMLVFAELLLLVLAILGIKNARLIRKLLGIDLAANMIFFNMSYGKYPLDQSRYPFYRVDEMNRRAEEEKYKLDEYSRAIGEVTEENLSLLYEKVEAMFVLLIVSSYVLNIFLIIGDSPDLLGGRPALSFSLAAGIIVFILYVTKIFILMMNYNKEYAVEFFRQESRGDKIFLYCIIAFLLLNFLLLSLSFVEVFGILFVMSYLFDLAYGKIILKKA